MNTTQIALLLAPIVILELVLIVVALRDLLKPERQVRGGSKLMWGLIIVFFNQIGTLLSSSLVAYGFARLRFRGRLGHRPLSSGG